MRAARVTATTGPGGIELAHVPDAVAGEGEMLVDVVAAGVNFPDLLLSRGAYQVRPELPFVPGSELTGVVREAPAGSGFATGDRVAGFTVTGGFAEVVALPVRSVLPLPDDVSFVAGACLPMNYTTMSFALRTRGGLQPGETVLVHGAAGGIGTATVQLATAMGAHVIAVVSTPEKAAFVGSLGSSEVVLADGFRESVQELTDGVGVDVVVDPVGGDRMTDSLRCLAPTGRLLVLGFTAGSIPTVKVNRLLLNNIDVRGVGWGEYCRHTPGALRREWDRLLPVLADAGITPPVDATFPLDRAGDAVALLAQRAVLGKVVVDVRA